MWTPSAATTGAPRGSSCRSSGWMMRNFTPSRPSDFTVATTVPITRASCIGSASLPAGAARRRGARGTLRGGLRAYPPSPGLQRLHAFARLREGGAGAGARAIACRRYGRRSSGTTVVLGGPPDALGEVGVGVEVLPHLAVELCDDHVGHARLPNPGPPGLDGRLHLGDLSAEQHIAPSSEVVGQAQLADRDPRRLHAG